MKRALGTQPPGDTSVASQIPAKPPKKVEHEKKESSKSQSPQRKSSVTAQPDKVKAVETPEVQKASSPVPSQKMQQEDLKTASPNKSPVQTRQTERKQSNATAVTQQESGGLFSFGGGQPDSKPGESVSGKMFGFGSSIFSSASTLITSAVQDQPKSTPPVSPKMSTAKEIKSPALQKREEQKKTENLQQTRTPPLGSSKIDKAKTEPTKATVVGQATVKPDKSACPLCKVELNMGSKDAPNYNTCTECKNNVCNQCGFNPMPNVSDVSMICTLCTYIIIQNIHMYAGVT